MAKTYDTYKDSGIAWIGNIPGEWKIKKLGNFYTQRNEKVSDKDFAPLSVTMQGILPQLETAAKTNDGDNRKLVRVGDFAINSRSDRRGSCGISPYDGSVSLINTVLCPKGKMNANFYNWLFHTTMFADEYYKWGHGIVDDLWTTRWSEMKNISVVEPPLSEQQAIDLYLDEKCGEIDSLISLQEEMISELQAYKQSVITEAVTKGLDPNVPMKDSSVEWIGQIPSNWGKDKIFRIFFIIGSGTTPKATDERIFDGNINWIQSGDINGGIMIECKNKISEIVLSQYSTLKIYKAPFIIVAMYGASVGNISISNIDGCVNQACCVMSDSRQCFSYLFYAIKAAKDYLIYRAEGGGQPNISQDKIKNLWLPLPPLSEQQAIASFLDEKTSQIDSLIALKQEKITELKDYKKSIIYEYITGKKKV